MTKVYKGAYYCPKCDKYFEIGVVSRAPWSEDAGPCADCGGPRKRKCVLKGSEQDPKVYTEQTNIAFKENIRVSHSMGVSMAQFAEAQKLHPGVEWKKVGHSMCPVIHNRTEKVKIMRQAGMTEYPDNYFNECEGKRR